MAQLAVPESVARTLYAHAFGGEADMVVVDTAAERLEGIAKRLAVLGKRPLVVKPDHAIGKRGKQGLLGLKLDAAGAVSFIKAQAGKAVGGKKLTRFLVVPFIAHDEEFYLSITAEADADVLRYSRQGGMDIEEQWGSVHELRLGLEQTDFDLPDAPEGLVAYAQRLLAMFREYGMVFLEINPLVCVDGAWLPLDFKLRLDTCAFFRVQSKLDIYGLVAAATDAASPVEERVRELDGLTDASLKFKLLNPNGRIWPLVAGGGASIIYFDSLVDLELGKQIAFYGEYSGNPPYELTYSYAAAIVDAMLKSTAKNKVLLLAGANANFTDVAATFKAIIKVLEERASDLKRQKVRILIRRGGPRVEEAFAALRESAARHGLSVTMEGVEHPLPHILEHL